MKSERYDSPKFDLWKLDARAYLQSSFGAEAVDVLDKTLRFRRAISPINPAGPMHTARLDRAIELLRELDSRAQPLATVLPADLGALHPAVHKRSGKLYASGHFTEAVEGGFKVVRDRLRQLTGYETGSEAFGKGGLRVTGAAEPWVDDDFNEGVKFLAMAIDRFRNEKAHVVDGNIDGTKALEYLAMASLAMRLLDSPAARQPLMVASTSPRPERRPRPRPRRKQT